MIRNLQVKTMSLGAQAVTALESVDASRVSSLRTSISLPSHCVWPPTSVARVKGTEDTRAGGHIVVSRSFH